MIKKRCYDVAKFVKHAAAGKDESGQVEVQPLV